MLFLSKMPTEPLLEKLVEGGTAPHSGSSGDPRAAPRTAPARSSATSASCSSTVSNARTSAAARAPAAARRVAASAASGSFRAEFGRRFREEYARWGEAGKTDRSLEELWELADQVVAEWLFAVDSGVGCIFVAPAMGGIDIGSVANALGSS